MYCRNCGKEIGKNDTFCSYCGTRIERRTVTQTQGNTRRENIQQVQMPTKQRRGKVGILLAVIVIVVAGLGVIVAIYSRMQEEKALNNQENNLAVNSENYEVMEEIDDSYVSMEQEDIVDSDINIEITKEAVESNVEVEQTDVYGDINIDSQLLNEGIIYIDDVLYQLNQSTENDFLNNGWQVDEAITQAKTEMRRMWREVANAFREDNEDNINENVWSIVLDKNGMRIAIGIEGERSGPINVIRIEGISGASSVPIRVNKDKQRDIREVSIGEMEELGAVKISEEQDETSGVWLSSYEKIDKTHFIVDFKDGKVDAIECGVEEGDSQNEAGIEIDATNKSASLNGWLEYRTGTNAAGTVDKEIYVLHLTPPISHLTYYNMEDELETAENITEIDVAGLDAYTAKWQFDGMNVCIKGEIRPNYTSHWFNAFSINMESFETLD